ncbi:VOC family protein [Methanolobus sp. ZRKC3]|uniref:VOC family protein n=1 Tax=Methanolobus sp. ZRKC3 TaxID=3125786 RepID=UPI00324814AB
MADNDFPTPSEGFVLTHTVIVSDVKTSCEWYKKMLDGKVVMEPSADGTPCIMKVANSWMILNFGGGKPTDDKPNTTVAVKQNHDVLSAFLNIRVADIHDFYKSRKARGAEFITEPKEHISETRCYMVDPDGYLIEVGEAKPRE